MWIEVLWFIWMGEIGVTWFFLQKESSKNLIDNIWAVIFPAGLIASFNWVLFCVKPQFNLKNIFTGKSSFQFFKWNFWLPQGSLHFLIWAVIISAPAGWAVVKFLRWLRKKNIESAEAAFKRKERMFDNPRIDKFDRVEYNPREYFKDNEEYFVGLYTIGKKKTRVPVYTNQEVLTQHEQVLGPSGTGKTTALFTLIAQAIQKKVPVIFVDGKGEADVVLKMKVLCPQMKLFSPALPQYSNTYNPLLSTTDPNKIASLLQIGMHIERPGEAKVWSDVQKEFLGTLLPLFTATGKKFNFIDILEFMVHRGVRKNLVYPLLKDTLYQTEMESLIEKYSKKEQELIGLRANINTWFVQDTSLASLINSYSSEVNIRDVMQDGGVVLFSFSGAVESHRALGKMVFADIFHAVMERHASLAKHRFVLMVLDEIGLYISEATGGFISTARSANVGCVFSHQATAQLKISDLGEKLAEIISTNANSTLLFRTIQEASDFSEKWGTKQSIQRTEQIEEDVILSEKISKMGTLKPTDEQITHANLLRNLQRGQAVWKSLEHEGIPLNLGELPIDKNKAMLERISHYNEEENGLNLRKKRIEQGITDDDEEEKKEGGEISEGI